MASLLRDVISGDEIKNSGRRKASVLGALMMDNVRHSHDLRTCEKGSRFSFREYQGYNYGPTCHAASASKIVEKLPLSFSVLYWYSRSTRNMSRSKKNKMAAINMKASSPCIVQGPGDDSIGTFPEGDPLGDPAVPAGLVGLFFAFSFSSCNVNKI